VFYLLLGVLHDVNFNGWNPVWNRQGMNTATSTEALPRCRKSTDVSVLSTTPPHCGTYLVDLIDIVGPPLYAELRVHAFQCAKSYIAFILRTKLFKTNWIILITRQYCFSVKVVTAMLTPYVLIESIPNIRIKCIFRIFMFWKLTEWGLCCFVTYFWNDPQFLSNSFFP